MVSVIFPDTGIIIEHTKLGLCCIKSRSLLVLHEDASAP